DGRGGGADGVRADRVSGALGGARRGELQRGAEGGRRGDLAAVPGRDGGGVGRVAGGRDEAPGGAPDRRRGAPEAPDREGGAASPSRSGRRRGAWPAGAGGGAARGGARGIEVFRAGARLAGEQGVRAEGHPTEGGAPGAEDTTNGHGHRAGVGGDLRGAR